MSCLAAASPPQLRLAPADLGGWYTTIPWSLRAGCPQSKANSNLMGVPPW
jgi:hypothetical protein